MVKNNLEREYLFLYKYLEKIIIASESKNIQELKRYNGVYNQLARKIYHSPLLPEDLFFDSCRRLCLSLLELSLSEEQKYFLVKEARQKFEIIPIPNLI